MKPAYVRSTLSWPLNLHAECQVIQQNAGYLMRLAAAFAVTGNNTMADDLWSIAAILDSTEQSIREHQDARLTADLKAVQESSGNMLRATLAGAKLGSQS